MNRRNRLALRLRQLDDRTIKSMFAAEVMDQPASTGMISERYMAHIDSSNRFNPKEHWNRVDIFESPVSHRSELRRVDSSCAH